MRTIRQLTLEIDEIRRIVENMIIDEAIQQIDLNRETSKKVWIHAFMVTVPNQNYIPTEFMINEVAKYSAEYSRLVRARLQARKEAKI